MVKLTLDIFMECMDNEEVEKKIIQLHFMLSYFIFFLICFLGPHPWHMEVPRLGV